MQNIIFKKMLTLRIKYYFYFVNRRTLLFFFLFIIFFDVLPVDQKISLVSLMSLTCSKAFGIGFRFEINV